MLAIRCPLEFVQIYVGYVFIIFFKNRFSAPNHDRIRTAVHFFIRCKLTLVLKVMFVSSKLQMYRRTKELFQHCNL